MTSPAEVEVPLLIAAPTEKWLAEAKPIAEAAINRLVQEFVEHPYLHRVEHSLHARLFGLLVDNPLFAGLLPIGKSGRHTQAVHKEWPETIRQPHRKGRGNFDIAILSPAQLGEATLDQFRHGRIAAGIVIEVGLDYKLTHLKQDHAKLLNSETPAGYLVHLSRSSKPDTVVRDWIRKHQSRSENVNKTSIGIAYVHHAASDASCSFEMIRAGAV